MFAFAKGLVGLGSILRVLPSQVSPAFITSSLAITSRRFKHEYAPRYKTMRKSMKGRVSIRTGGSIKGNKLEFGEYGLRLKSEGIRFSAMQLQAADKVLRRELRPSRSQLITRFVCSLAICVKGNQTRMGKGKGPFDHWAVRVPTGKVLFEIRGNNIHDRVAREALRKASDKLPGLFEIITPESKIRVSPTCLIDAPEPVDYAEKMAQAPTKKWANIQASKTPEYLMYRGR